MGIENIKNGMRSGFGGMRERLVSALDTKTGITIAAITVVGALASGAYFGFKDLPEKSDCNVIEYTVDVILDLDQSNQLCHPSNE